MNFYSASGGELIIRDSEGRELWRGRPEGRAVIWAESIPDSQDGLALYDPYPPEWQKMQHEAFQNLVRVSSNGRVVWRAELPDKPNRYVRAAISDDRVKARALSYDVVLDMLTGKILERVWTK